MGRCSWLFTVSGAFALVASALAFPAAAALSPVGVEAVLDPGPAPSCGGGQPDVAAL